MSFMVAVSAAAMTPSEPEVSMKRGIELYEQGRWSDARHQFMKLREALPREQRGILQDIDFYLAMCAMELGDSDVEQRLLSYMDTYSGSVYNNDIRFALAMYYCTRDDYARAREAFADVNYRMLTPKQREKYDVRMGYIEFLEGHYDAAFIYFDRIGSSSEYYDHAVYYKAYVEYIRGNYQVSKRLFTSLRKSDAYAEIVPYYLLQIEYKEGNYPYVVETGASLLPNSSAAQRVDLQRIMAESYFRMNNYRKAIDLIRAFEKSGGEMGREENYILGYSLYRTANYDEARAALQKVCGADDALTQNASYHLADCCLRLGDKVNASKAFAMASNEAFDARIAEDALFNYGKLQYELGGGTFNEAVNVLTRYIETYPSSDRQTEARELLIAAYFNSHNYESAYTAIKSFPDPDSSIRAALQKITYFRALEAYTQGDPDRAENLLEESLAIDISPKYNALGSFWLGEIYYGRGDYRTAAEKYAGYLERAPRSEREYKLALYNLGYARFSMGEMAEAQRNFSSFLSSYRLQDNYRADAFNRRGDAYYSLRQFDSAVKDYESAAAVGTNERYYAQYQRALALGILGRTGQKIDALKSIVDNDRGNYVDDATYELGRTYIAQEQYRNGADMLERFIAGYPNSRYYTSALLDLGLAYANLNETDRSLQYYDKVISQDPQSSDAKEALRSVREIYVASGNVDSYFDYAAKAGVECDLSQMARDSLSFESAQKIYSAGKTGEAIRLLERYVAEYPKGYYLNDALFYLGDSYLKSDRPDDAITTLITLSERPTSQYTQRVLDELSRLTYDEGRYGDAAKAYRKLYDVETQVQARNDAMTGYVRSVKALGDDDAVVAMADDVEAQADAGEVALREARYAKARVLEKRGDVDGAVEIYRKLSADVRYAEGAEASYKVIAREFDKGNTDEAEKLVYAFADKNTPHSYWLGKSFILLGDIYRMKGDTFQARATYQSVVDGYTPTDDGIVDEARERIAKLN